MHFTDGRTGLKLLFLSAILILPLGCKKPPQDMIQIPKGTAVIGSNEVDKEAKALQYGDRRPW